MKVTNKKKNGRLAFYSDYNALKEELAEFKRTEPKKRAEMSHIVGILNACFDAGNFDGEEIIDDLPRLITALRKERDNATEQWQEYVRQFDSAEAAVGENCRTIAARDATILELRAEIARLAKHDL